MTIIPVILSGGSGTRLWPLSRTALPKQLLPLLSGRTMLQDAVTRLAGLPGAGRPLLVCNHEHRFLAAEQVRELGVEPRAIFLEPVGRNTAPAIAAAAFAIARDEPDALILALPADHLVRDVAAFHGAAGLAADAARAGRLVTFGIKPDRPETGYGYIRAGAAIAPGVFAVERFVEKPDLATAGEYVASGQYFWNSGMFMFGAKRYLEELRRLRPAIHEAARKAVEGSYRDLDFFRLEQPAFEGCPAESVDCAVMEHTRSAAVVPVDMGWSDVGSWLSVWEVSPKDAAGNVTRGDVFLEGARNCLVRAESRIVAGIGVEDLVIVETPDAVLVVPKSRAQDVRKAVDHLQRNGRTEHRVHTRVFRPWGWYEGVDAGERFQVKRIMVKPGEKLSLQMHHHRAEHWVVVSGTARVTRGDQIFVLSENESTFIPLGMVHRLENPGKVPLHIIEVQSGGYLGEDDIVRLEDAYKRA